MAGKLIVFAAVVASIQAVPLLIDSELFPGMSLRMARSPGLAMSTAYTSNNPLPPMDDFQAYGASFSAPGNSFASGIAKIGSPYPDNQQVYTVMADMPMQSAHSMAQTLGNSGSAISSARTQNGLFNSARTQNAGYQSAGSSANFGVGGSRAVAQATNGSPYGFRNSGAGIGSASSSAEVRNGMNTYIFRQLGQPAQHSSASSISAPGIQAANAQAMNGYF